MKKFLLSLLLMASVNSIFAQVSLPCPTTYKINNGGGSCPDIVVSGVTLSATGSITLSFDGTITADNIPVVSSVTNITDPANSFPVTGITFGPGTLLTTGDVLYCYYVGPNNNNNLSGHNAEYRFFVSYNAGAHCGLQSPLPVKFKSFSAARNHSAIALNWVTASEQNNSGFAIERLIGAGGWQQIVFIPSQAAGGNSTTDLSYQFSDNNGTTAVSQYRLKQIDFDNKSSRSDIRAVRGEGQTGKTIVYPNPSNNGRVSVVFDNVSATRDISLMDLSGRMIKQIKAVTNNNIQFDNLTPGVYSLRVVNRETGDQVVEKIIVNNR